MDLLLNEQQRMLQSTIQDLLRRDFTKEALIAIDAGTSDVSQGWPALASTGLLGSLVPEEHGGVGGSFADAGVVSAVRARVDAASARAGASGRGMDRSPPR